MAERLSSRERMLAAINHQEPDYVPLWFNWYYKDTQILQWDDIVDRAERVLAMGLDDTIRIDVPESVHPETSTRVWVEHPADSRYPLIHKEYYTPKGAMRQIVKQTEEIAATHQAGAKFSYIQTSGVGPRLDDLLDLGIDILWGADPIQDRTANFPVWKRQAGDKICFLGGLNAHATLINASEDDIRREVRYARETLGPGGGLILSPIDNIYPYTPRRNLEILIDEWKRVRDYA
jgi:uroporphyrinogen-III decarboxylase